MEMFKLQLVFPDGSKLPFSAGGQFERDLVESIKKAVIAKGVGLWKSEAHVAQDIEDGIKEVLLNLKRETLPYAGMVKRG